MQKWKRPHCVKNGEAAPADDSNGNQSYALLNKASLSTILTTEDQSLQVKTTNTSFDRAAMEVVVQTPSSSNILCLQAWWNGPPISATALTANEILSPSILGRQSYS